MLEIFLALISLLLVFAVIHEKVFAFIRKLGNAIHIAKQEQKQE